MVGQCGLPRSTPGKVSLGFSIVRKARHSPRVGLGQRLGMGIEKRPDLGPKGVPVGGFDLGLAMAGHRP